MYHFHLYYEVSQIKKAQEVLDHFRANFNFPIGRVWDRPVGPHPIGSCQITVPSGDFEEVTNWFFDNRQELDLFVHRDSGNDLKDHTEAVMWIGKSYDLKLEIFQ